MKTICAGIGLAAMLFSAQSLFADSHGPAFGLATPTLAEGQWSSDTMGMSLGTEKGTMFQFREMAGYGINPDLQALLSFPLSPTIDPLTPRVNTRMGAMGGSGDDVEGSLLWRFFRRAPAVGTRYESSVLVGGAVPTEWRLGNIRNSPSLNLAAVSGYASRTFYGWIGGGIQRHFDNGNDRIGTLPYVTAVFGYRPPLFQKDYPKPDWRIFIENVDEFPQRDKISGVRDADSGGEKVLIGPSVLGLYGKWGVEGGVLFPAYQRMNGSQPDERFRVKLVFTYWF